MRVRSYLALGRRQRWLIGLGLLLGVLAGVLTAVLSTPTYASTARLFVSTPSDASSQAYQGSLFSQQRVTSYADLITGDKVAQLVVDRLHLDQSAESLAGQVSSAVVPNTVILEVTVTTSDRYRAQQLAQTFAEVFTGYVGVLETAPGQKNPPIKTTIVGAARLPTSPVSPRPGIDIPLGAALGLLAGIGAALLRESLDTTIRSQQSLHRATGAAHLGSLYLDPLAARQPLVTQHGPSAPRTEAFRVLRTNLQYLNVDRESQVFVITSPLPGTGKTTTAINIAITMAQAGLRTVLVEADLRRPTFARYLGMETGIGLSTVLSRQVGLDDALQPWGLPGLVVLGSGGVPPNPAELLQSKAMGTLLDELRTRFDVVIVDSPPLLPVTDATVLASHADSTILMVRYGETTGEQASSAVQRLQAAGVKVQATLLNWVPATGAEGYGYGYDAPVDSAQPVTAPPAAASATARTAPGAAGVDGAPQGQERRAKVRQTLPR